MTAPIDYRNYQDNKSGFISSLLSQNFIPYAKEIGIEPLRQQDHQVSYYSINDLFSIPGISNLPSVLYFQNLSNYDNVDLVEVRTQLAQLQSELKTVTDSIEYNDEVIKFFGDIATDVNDITGTVRESFNLDVENDVNFKKQVNASLSDEAINSFGLQGPETPIIFNETATGIAGQSNILTLGGNFYNKDGQYTNKNGEVIVGPDGNAKEAPYKKGDGWELFWQRGDIFEIQQRIVAAGGPAPERLGVWDSGLEKYMNSVLAFANDSLSWESDVKSGISLANAWNSALEEFRVQNEGGTQLAEILTAVGYSTINEPKPTASETKDKVDELYGEFGIKATAKDYQDIGNAFMELSQQAAARQDEIESKAVGLKDLLLGTTKFMSSPPNMETPEGLEYQKALNDGRILETSTGIYMIPDPEQLAQDKNIPEAIDVDTTLRQQIQDREATGIQGVKDRDMARSNATLFKKNYLTTVNTGLG
tara:strand:- start:11 stop:1444 length:1434 start_codon:yes stop_codon:yes gene_type:complete